MSSHAAAFSPVGSFGVHGDTAGARGSRNEAGPTMRRRLEAWAVDSAVLGSAWASIWLLVSASETSNQGPIGGFAETFVTSLAAVLADSALSAPVPGWALSAVLVIACWPLLAVPYYAFAEGVYGATAGKRLLGLSVSTHPGAQKPGVRRALVRALLRPVDALLFGLVGFVAARNAGDGRRLGDLAAGTIVRTAGVPTDAEVEAQKVRAGLEAERAARRVLVPLADEGYYVFFNVEHRHFGDMDALVIGPDGITVVEVKGHNGFVTAHAETGELLRDGRPFEKDFHRQLELQAEHIASSLGIYRGPGDDPSGPYAHTPLQPRLVFTSAEVLPNGRGAFPQHSQTLPVLEEHFRSGRLAAAQGRPLLGAVEARELALRVQEVYGAYPLAPSGHPNNPGGASEAG